MRLEPAADRDRDPLLRNRQQGKAHPLQDQPRQHLPQGFFWSNELVRQKYITAPAGLTDNGAGALPKSLDKNVFRCPTGLFEPMALSGFEAQNPRSGKNRQFVAIKDPNFEEAVATWYGLNSITIENGTLNGAKPFTGSIDAPFAWYNGKSASETDTHLKNPAITRTISMVRKSSNLVMAFDGNTYNWNNIDGSTGLSARMSGRHGKATNKGQDGMMNVAFFDGHVTLLSTEPYTKAGTDSKALSATKGEYIFWLHDQ